MRKLQTCWLYGLDMSKGNIYIDVLCANEEVEWKVGYFEVRVVSNNVGGLLRMVTAVRVTDAIAKVTCK